MVCIHFFHVQFRLTSDFGLSLVDYFALIPKVHRIAVVSRTIHIFINNYPSALDSYFIYSVLDKDFCAIQKKFKIQNEFSDRRSKHGIPMPVDKTQTIHGLADQ